MFGGLFGHFAEIAHRFSARLRGGFFCIDSLLRFLGRFRSCSSVLREQESAALCANSSLSQFLRVEVLCLRNLLRIARLSHLRECGIERLYSACRLVNFGFSLVGKRQVVQQRV